jgi:protein associated with RNAse G/E
MVVVRYTKYDGSLHWHFAMRTLGSDEYGVWLGAPDGTAVQRGLETPIISPAFTVLIPRRDWWTAVWNAGGGALPFHYEVYVDVTTPAVWDPRQVTMVDLDLDVVRTRAGECSIRDEDEFAEHAVAFGYPAEVAAAARLSADSLLGRLQRREEPFDRVGPAYLERAAALR